MVHTAFWTDIQVIDHYSIEDKFFHLYLMTNDKTTQVGIYPLPMKVMSFETGFTTDDIQLMLERFKKDYGKILYSKKTQEVTVLHSLQYTILKGGKPVSDLMKRELSTVKDGKLILATYKEMKDFWASSRRKFDQEIKRIFEQELASRDLMTSPKIENLFQMNEDNQILSSGTDTPKDSEEHVLERYIQYFQKQGNLSHGEVTANNILTIFYGDMIDLVTPHVQKQLDKWEKTFSKSIILEALQRSASKSHPLSYTASI